MSYVFSVRAATAALAMAAVAAKFDEVVTSQPIHAADREQAQAAAEAFIGLVPLPEGREYTVSVSGSVGKVYFDGEYGDDLGNASVSVNVSTVIPDAATG